MNISDVKTIFSTSNYICYSEARQIVKEVLKDPKILENAQSEASKKLDQFLIKDIKNCKKTSKFLVLLLKIKNLIKVLFDCCTHEKAKKQQVFTTIIQYAEKKLTPTTSSITPPSHSTKTATPPTPEIPIFSQFEPDSFDEFMKKLNDFERSIGSCLLVPTEIHMGQAYQHHQICDKLGEISKKMQSEPDNAKKKAWKMYLDALHKRPVVYPDSIERKLKTKVARRFFNNDIPKITVTKLSSLSSADIQKIMKVEKEAFTSMELMSNKFYDEAKHKERLESANNHIFYLAKDKDKIVGVLEYDPLHKILFSIARRAMYSQSKVGSLLWEEFAKDYKGKKVALHVRESNPAMGLYKKWGFNPQKMAPYFYDQPIEDALVMQNDTVGL